MEYESLTGMSYTKSANYILIQQQTFFLYQATTDGYCMATCLLTCSFEKFGGQGTKSVFPDLCESAVE